MDPNQPNDPVQAQPTTDQVPAQPEQTLTPAPSTTEGSAIPDVLSGTKVKQLRVAIDATIKQAQTLAEEIGRGPGGREISLVITKLQEGKMWGGKILEAFGSSLPEEYRDEAK